MLFMGSQKYPIENHYDEFLKSHGGTSNAFTEGEQTVYYFNVSQDHFQEALDIFGNFLIEPLLLPNATEREVKAVQSEFEDNFLDDHSRRLQIHNMLAKSDHPFNCFPFGNTQSLIEIPESMGLDINTELRNFFNTHYTADKMFLTLQSHHSLDSMEEWVKDIFSCIKSSGQPSSGMIDYIHPFTEEFNRFYRLCPTRDIHELVITWSLPSQLSNYLEKPHHYLSTVIGDESTGSLMSFLRQKRLALQIVAGNDESNDEHNRFWCGFTVTIQLTDQGLRMYESVLRYFFAYLDMVKRLGPQERIFNELKLINQIRFDYQDECDAMDNCNSLCQHLRLFPVEHVLSGSFAYEKWNPDGIINCLEHMKPEMSNIVLSSRTFEQLLLDGTSEPWFKTKFKREPLNPELWSNFTKEDWGMFSLPAPNQFIPQVLNVKMICDNTINAVQLEGESVGARLWYKGGAMTYGNPKSCVSLLLYSDFFCDNSKTRTALDIYLALLQLQLMEKIYPASQAGLKCSIKLHEVEKYGIKITFSGFSDKLSALLELVLNEISNFSFNEEDFEIISAEIERECKNSVVAPMDFCHQLRLATILNDYCAKFQRLRCHYPNTFFDIADFRSFLSQWRESKACMLDCFISGNFDLAEAKEIFERTKSLLSPFLCPVEQTSSKLQKLLQKSQCISLKTDDSPVVAAQRISVANDDNFAVVAYYQFGPGDFRSHVCAQLFDVCFPVCLV